MLLPNFGAVLTVVLGFLGLLFPNAVGRVLGIDLDRPLGTSEFRATYGGFFAVQARMALNSWKRKCASTPVSDGMTSISQCCSPDGLRRSAFNSTPFAGKLINSKCVLNNGRTEFYFKSNGQSWIPWSRVNR
jgi:hypothetical protein